MSAWTTALTITTITGSTIFLSLKLVLSEKGVFGSLEPEPEPLEKNQEPEPLKN